MDPRLLQPKTTKNLAGGAAYASSPEEALASYAGTGMFGSTYYADAKEHLDKVRELALSVDNAFLAKLALYAREKSKLKDVPAFLTALLTSRPGGMSEAERIFPRTIDNAKQLRTFAQLIRSGTFGRKNLSSRAMRRIIGRWFESRTADQLFRDSIGGSVGGPGQPPRLTDVWYAGRFKVAAGDVEKSALYGYLRGKGWGGNCPTIVTAYEMFKSLDPAERKMTQDIARLPLQLLDSLRLTKTEWATLALFGGYKFTIKNLNTFIRHGCTDDQQWVRLVAEKLAERPPRHVYPYELWMAWKYAEAAPLEWKAALQHALHLSLESTPVINQNVIVCPDVSASMHSAISGARGTATSKARCIDVAALIAAAIASRSEGSLLLPFDHRVHYGPFPQTTLGVAELTKLLAAFGGGGTDCAIPMRALNAGHFPAIDGKIGAVVYVSDYESWVQAQDTSGYARQQYAPSAWSRVQWQQQPSMYAEWLKLKARNPGCKLVLLDTTPHATSQVSTDRDILQIGGFSDSVFDVIAQFLNGNVASWVDVIRAYE